MKNINRFLVLIIPVSGILFYSCETMELDKVVDPNELSVDQSDPDLLLNSIQLDYLNSMSIFNDISEDLSRITQSRARDYLNFYGPTTLNNAWLNIYSGIIPDVANIQALHDDPDSDRDLSFHLGISKTIQAHSMMLLVDFLGDIVYSQANNPVEFPFPVVDDDEDVYDAAFTLLEEARDHLNTASVGSATDFFYGGDTDKWLKLVNTLEMRFNLTVGNYSEVVNASAVIVDSEDDMVFKYGTNVLSPDSRHPDYASDYRDRGTGFYKSNWLMDLMVGEFGDFSADTDPRRRYYFYRQSWITPGNYALFEDVLGLIGPPGAIYISFENDIQEGIICSIDLTPPHLQFTPDEDTWCSLPLGYWGRPHGNGGGFPPDSFDRTATGVYPSGGSFDAAPDAFPWVGVFPDLGQQVGLGNGGGGAGIEPIMLASFVDFMKAEANLHLGNLGPATMHFEAGITKSISKVMAFVALDVGADLSQAPDATTVANFIADKVAEFGAASLTSGLDGFGWPVEKDKMDLLGEQYFIAMYGGGADGFNFIRRTGYPRTLQRHLFPVPGPFPRTFLYPSNEVSTNPNLSQRTDLNTLVFWDQGILNPAN
ncbi:MAG: SusD/RagB family nutrient-binding outer membrane lipoprotein [Bacteroidia bacterium]|nr:SusD/RagB family nutrient-binding outer membrane lipoprotein [Bacteroidia bacterium]